MISTLKITILCSVILSFSSACFAKEALKDNLPNGWFKTGANPDGYVVMLDDSEVYQGSKSVLIASKHDDVKKFGSVVQSADADDFKGTRVKLSAYVKSENVKDWAGIWFRVDDKQGKVIAFDNMKSRKIEGTTDWTQYSLVLDIKQAATRLVYGALLAGSGKIWFDDITFETVDTSTPVTDMYAKQGNTSMPRNLSFENE